MKKMCYFCNVIVPFGVMMPSHVAQLMRIIYGRT